MPNKRTLAQVPDSSALEEAEELIRLRAYGLYEERGRENGHDLEDWLRAEAEILEKKQPRSTARSRAAAGAA